MMSAEEFQRAADDRLFNLIRVAIEPLLAQHAPLYAVDQVGLIGDRYTDELILKIHLRQNASVRARPAPERGFIRLSKEKPDGR